MATRLYVGNLPFSADEKTVRALFEQNKRNVREVRIIEDRETGRPRGFGFVELADDSAATEAIRRFDGYTLDGRQLRVNEAQERPGGNRSGGNRSGGSRSGYGGGYNSY